MSVMMRVEVEEHMHAQGAQLVAYVVVPHAMHLVFYLVMFEYNSPTPRRTSLLLQSLKRDTHPWLGHIWTNIYQSAR